MELKIENGDYVLGTSGNFSAVDGSDAVLQRAVMRLTAKRGSFLPLPEYGSRLHTLCRLKPNERAAAARAYVQEALEVEPEVSLGTLRYLPDGKDGAVLEVELLYGQSSSTVEVTV